MTTLMLDQVLRALSLAETNVPTDELLRRVLAARHPLAAALLADRRRQASVGDRVTYPVTLRVRIPGIECDEPPTLVSHDVSDLEGIEATEIELISEVPDTATLPLLVEWVETARAERTDLPIRGFTTDAILGVLDRHGTRLAPIFEKLAGAGLSALSWEPGSDLDPRSLDVHRAAHAAGLRTSVVLPYAQGGLRDALLERIAAIAKLADETGGVASVVPLPDRTEGASPLEGTAGTEDMLVFALARLGLAASVQHVTVDAHVLGHKLGAILLAAGADDFVGAQAAAAWPAPSNDAPRPLNADRVVRYVEEARREPYRRGGAFGVEV